MEVVFDMGGQLVEKQLEWIDRLDTKLGTLWALITAALVWSANFVSSCRQLQDLLHPPGTADSGQTLLFLSVFGAAEQALKLALILATAAMIMALALLSLNWAAAPKGGEARESLCHGQSG